MITLFVLLLMGYMLVVLSPSVAIMTTVGHVSYDPNVANYELFVVNYLKSYRGLLHCMSRP